MSSAGMIYCRLLLSQWRLFNSQKNLLNARVTFVGLMWDEKHLFVNPMNHVIMKHFS